MTATRRTRPELAITLALALAGPSLAATGCLGAGGEACRLDSDCASGLVCSLEGTCTRYADMVALLAQRPDVGDTFTAPDADAATTSDGVDDTSACATPLGHFTCDGPAAQRTVTGLVLADSGHGMARLAGLANPIIASNFGDGTVRLDLWIDGTFAPGCSINLAWVRGPDDVGTAPDCLPAFVGQMPFDIPGLVHVTVYEAALDPATLVLTGLVDKDELIASMDPALRDTAGTLIDLDVDTDHDGSPDKASIIMTVALAP